MGQKQKWTSQKEQQDQAEERETEKLDQTHSPEIPDRGETSEIPSRPSGAPDRHGEWYHHFLTLFVIFFTRAIPKGLTFGLNYVMCMFCIIKIVFNLCEI